MSQNFGLIGQGLIVLDFGFPSPDSLQLRYEINALGIQFFNLVPDGKQSSLFDLVGNRTPTLRRGSLSLAALPASPLDTFFGLSLAFNPSAFTLHVINGGVFCQRHNLQLSGLDLSFTVRNGEVNLAISGALTAVILGQTIALSARLSEEFDLTFTPLPASPPLSIAPIGTMDGSALHLRRNPDRWSGLQALYAFDEGTGNLAHDSSGIIPPLNLNLTVKQPAGPPVLVPPRDASWIPSALSIDPTLESVPNFKTLILTATPPTRLMDAWSASGEITIEAWVRPIRAQQSGPASIITVSQDPQTRLVTVAQGSSAPGKALFTALQRTSATPLGDGSISTADTTSTTDLTYLVYVRDAAGNERLFLNGTTAATGFSPGRLFGNDNFQLVLANEVTGDRPWAGEFHRVALYNRAFPEDTVRANFLPVFAIPVRAGFSADGRLTFASPGAPVTAPSFDGDLWIDGDRILLKGGFRLFAESSPLQVIELQPIPIDSSGQLQFSGPVDVTLEDFLLLRPQLSIHGPQTALTGTWLGESASFAAVNLSGAYRLVGTIGFTLPFSVTLPAIIDSSTGARLSDGISIQSSMTASLVVELSSSGFLATVDASFTWQDDSSAAHTSAVPEFRLTSPPRTRNELLGLILEELEANAAQIFAGLLKNAADYYFEPSVPPAGGIIFFGSNASSVPTHLDIPLPQVFSAPAGVLVESNVNGVKIFHVQQSAAGCNLSFDLAGQPEDAIEASYANFLQQLETPPAGATLLPGAVPMILSRIAERLPMPFERVLFFHYGLNAAQNSIDLQPGMRLRVEYQHYQLVHPSDHSGISGFVGGTLACYQVNSYSQASAAGPSQYVLGFDGFLSNVPMKVGTDPSVSGAGGVLDLQQAVFRRPFYRLFYPSLFSGADAAAWTGSERVATLVGADSLADLRSATTEYLANGKVANTNTRVTFFFRGRAAVVPEIPIFVGERMVHVPVGTTVRHLLEAYAGIPAAALTGQNLRAFRGALRPRRLIHDGVNSSPSYRYIDFDSFQTFASRQDVYDLPVLKGDRFYF